MTPNACEPGLAEANGSDRSAVGEIVEFALLLPRDHLIVLTRMAEDRGTAVARLLRQAVWEFLIRELQLHTAIEGREQAPWD